MGSSQTNLFYCVMTKIEEKTNNDYIYYISPITFHVII